MLAHILGATSVTALAASAAGLVRYAYNYRLDLRAARHARGLF